MNFLMYQTVGYVSGSRTCAEERKEREREGRKEREVLSAGKGKEIENWKDGF
jgi:hypothetical protein